MLLTHKLLPMASSTELPSDIGLPSDLSDSADEGFTIAEVQTEPDPPVIMQRPARKQAQPGSGQMVLELVGTPDMPPWLPAHILTLPPPRFTDNDHFMEICTPPRIMPWIHRAGLRGTRSMDRDKGWNRMRDEVVHAAFEELHHRQPYVTMLPPPCAALSKLMDVNFGTLV